MARERRQGSEHVRREWQEAAVASLSAFRREGGLTEERVLAVARELGVGERTVWRWVQGDEPGVGRVRRASFVVTDEDIRELAYWHGNIAALHIETTIGRASTAAGNTNHPVAPPFSKTVAVSTP